MAERTLTATDHLKLVEHYSAELIQLAHIQCPHATIEVLPILHEDEDAHIIVFLPEGTCDSTRETLREALTKQSTEILLDTGLLILAGVYDISQRRTS